ncbi:hypothetical protein MAR_017606, partial [Mya arenaria]
MVYTVSPAFSFRSEEIPFRIRISVSARDHKTFSHHCPPGSEQGRAPTWHAFNKDAGSEVSRHGVKSEPTRPRPAYPFPSLHLIQ